MVDLNYYYLKKCIQLLMAYGIYLVNRYTLQRNIYIYNYLLHCVKYKQAIIFKYKFIIIFQQGNLGAFIITNIRLVWYAENNETFNISLPYIHINSVS